MYVLIKIWELYMDIEMHYRNQVKLMSHSHMKPVKRTFLLRINFVNKKKNNFL